MQKKFWIKKIIGFTLLVVLCVAVVGYVVMQLWNQVLAAVVPVSVVSYWQALGLLLLSKILFGGFHGGGRKAGWKKEMQEKWHTMTPEERDRIKQEWREKCRIWKKNAPHQTDAE